MTLHRIPAIFSVIFFVHFFALGSTILACINPIGRSQVSEPIYINYESSSNFIRDLTTHEDKAYWAKTLAELKRSQKSMPFLENRNNLAVAMLHLGQVKEAIQILKDLEKKKPGLYFTAANLGTAYELNGENHKALHWIKEGINRNADAHDATEWLHVKILEAKLAIENDPNWLKTNSVLGVNLAAGDIQSVTATDHLGKSKSLSEIESALVYQLHERLEFVKPPEAVVADLLFDLSRVFTLTATVKHVDAIRTLAQSYGSDYRATSTEINTEKEIHRNGSPTSKYIVYGGLAIIGAISAVAISFLFTRNRRSTSQ